MVSLADLEAQVKAKIEGVEHVVGILLGAVRLGLIV